MKKSKLILIFILCQNYSFADSGSWQQFCETISMSAYTTMLARQKGVSMSDTMKIAEKQPEPNRKFFESMIIAAWEIPRFSTDEIQKKTNEEFRDAWYLQCAKNFKGK